jgi:ADP-heptose:LPS heptosyltransferase
MTTWEQARNILAVRLDNAGDVIMLGPALRAVKERTPQARITLLASPAGAKAAALLPWIDDVIILQAVWQELGGRPLRPEHELRLIATLAACGFDAALIFTSFSQTPHVPAYVCFLAGIPLRAGESKEFGGMTLTTWLPPAPDDLHQTERNLRLVESLGFPARHRHLHVALRAEDRAQARALLAAAGVDAGRPFVLLHPGASAPARRYPARRMGELAQLLLTAGVQVLAGGGPRDRPLIEDLLATAPLTPVLSGDADLGTYAALIESAAAVVCGNTLPLHLGEAVGTPVVAFYSGTDLEAQWRPRATPAALLRRETVCYPCYLIECPIGLPCLDIQPAEASRAVLRLIERERAVGEPDTPAFS